MQILEARWLGERLARVPDHELFPLLDVGSSTLEYRTREQPYIEEFIFAPLHARGGRVWTTDLKSAPGIDHAGDMLDPRFVDRLAGLGARSANVFNILHHVLDREAFCAGVQRAVGKGGLVFLSGPHRYPRHFDPLDTLFRPDPLEVATLFPGARVLDSAVIDSGNWRQWDVHERGGRSWPRTLARACVPIYRPKKWLEAAVQVPYIVKHIQSWTLVLRLP